MLDSIVHIACCCQAEELSTVQHVRNAEAAGQPAQQQKQQHTLPPLKSKQGRASLESQHEHDLISTGVYTTTFSPSSLRGRLESEASSGERFFRGRGSTSHSGDGSSLGHGPDYAAAFDSVLPARVQLDVAFEGLGLKLKSCGKVVLQGVSGRLEHGRLAAVMGPSGNVPARAHCHDVHHTFSGCTMFGSKLLWPGLPAISDAPHTTSMSLPCHSRALRHVLWVLRNDHDLDRVHAIPMANWKPLCETFRGAVSGAGKTTLLTALAGRASYGILSGKVTINGR
jgi:hypothetical protein